MKQQAYQIERDRRVLVAHPKCTECLGTDIASLVAELRRRIDGGEADSVVVDLSNVQHMDSCCLGRLISLNQHAHAAGGSVALARCQPNVEFLFKMTRLDRVLGLYDTLEDAIAELRDRRTRPRPRHDRPDKNSTDDPRKSRNYAPMLAALLRAHNRINAPQPVAPKHPLRPDSRP